jgi:hypothetical protein
MFMKIFVLIVVLVAVVVGVLNIAPLRSDVIPLALFSEFFSAALPILAFGALIKYLCSCGKKCGCGMKECPACNTSK